MGLKSNMNLMHKYFDNKFQEIAIAKNGMILISKANTEKEILFSELDKIYISVYKIPPIYDFLFIVFSLGLVIFSLLYLPLILFSIIFLLIIITVILKMNNYKSYQLKIKLKNGGLIKKQVPLKLKYEMIDAVNKVRKEIYNYKIKESI